MSQDNATIERVARAICEATSGPFEMLDDVGRDALRCEARAAITAYLSAMPQRELLREALAYAHQIEQCVAEFLDAYTAFNNDELDEVSMNDAEHGMKLAMYAFREARAAADKIRAALTQEKQKGEGLP